MLKLYRVMNLTTNEERFVYVRDGNRAVAWGKAYWEVGPGNHANIHAQGLTVESATIPEAGERRDAKLRKIVEDIKLHCGNAEAHIDHLWCQVRHLEKELGGEG